MTPATRVLKRSDFVTFRLKFELTGPNRIPKISWLLRATMVQLVISICDSVTPVTRVLKRSDFVTFRLKFELTVMSTGTNSWLLRRW